MGAAGDGAGERYRSWYLIREEIERGSPSRRDGVGTAREAELRATYSSFIREVCFRLQLPWITLATAILLCHRFYLRQSLARNEWQTIATVCVFLASKIEETPCQLRHVVTVAYETMYQKNPDAAKRIHQDEVLEKQKTLILVGEMLLLSTIGFDFNIQHPYEPLKLALKNLGITQKEVEQAALNLINDTLPTTLALQFEPHYIAAGSLFLAAKFHNISLSETGEIWWQAFDDLALKQLKVVLQQMTELFKKRDPCSMGPIKPNLIPTPVDKQQMISTPSPEIRPPPTPTLMDRQITSTEGPAPRHTHSSRRRISDSATVASRCLHVDSLSCNKSICSSARDEQNPSVRVTEGPAPRHAQSSRRRISGSATVASGCLHVDSSSCNNSICSSARDEQNLSLRVTEGPAPRHAQSSRRRISDSATVASRCLHVNNSSCNKSICSSARDEQNQSLRMHINHGLNIVAVDQRSEKQSSWGTPKADHVYHVSSGPKDTSKTSIRDLTRQKRRIQEIGGYPAAGDISDQGAWMGRQLRSVIVIETNSSWKRQKVERG